MTVDDGPAVLEIYDQGIATGNATLETATRAWPSTSEPDFAGSASRSGWAATPQATGGTSSSSSAGALSSEGNPNRHRSGCLAYDVGGGLVDVLRPARHCPAAAPHPAPRAGRQPL